MNARKSRLPAEALGVGSFWLGGPRYGCPPEAQGPSAESFVRLQGSVGLSVVGRWAAAQGLRVGDPWLAPPQSADQPPLPPPPPAVIHLVQVDDSRYPFRSQPPAYIRAQLYKYWFTEAGKDG